MRRLHLALLLITLGLFKPAGDDGDGDDGDDTADVTPKFTQADLDKAVQRRAAQAERAARQALEADLGETVAEARARREAAAKADADNMTAAEKALAEAKRIEAEASAKLTAATQTERVTTARSLLIEAGLNAKQAAAFAPTILASVEGDPDADTIGDAIEAFRELAGPLFGTPAAPPAGSYTPARPRKETQKPAASTSLQQGAERAKARFGVAS